MIEHAPFQYDLTGAPDHVGSDAERACRAFRDDVWLVCRNAPVSVRQRGDAAITSFRTALRSTKRDPDAAVWRAFARAVWALLAELDRYPSQASWRWRNARGALARVIVDNVDLLDATSLAKGVGAVDV